MEFSRRDLVASAASLTAGGLVESGLAVGGPAGSAGRPGPQTTYLLHPIGLVEKQKGQRPRIVLFEKYAAGLKGLADWSHVHVFWWFDRNDTPQRRAILQVHPRGDRQNPLTGVFACRAPVRPNLIALSVCKIISVTGNVLTVDQIDAFDGTPVLDLKPVIPPDRPKELRVPSWARGGPRKRA